MLTPGRGALDAINPLSDWLDEGQTVTLRIQGGLDMGHGHRSRSPIGRISGLSRVESADVISRVRSAERISGAAAIETRMPPQRTFAEALERNGRGLVRSEPIPSAEPVRPLPPPVRQRDNESLELPERLPDSFLGLLWWKVKGRL